MFEILHHGAVNGVTGSCHQLKLANGASVLVDCGLFQGAESLLNFVKRMRHKPQHIRIVHGDDDAKRELQRLYREMLPGAEVVIG